MGWSNGWDGSCDGWDVVSDGLDRTMGRRAERWMGWSEWIEQATDGM